MIVMVVVFLAITLGTGFARSPLVSSKWVGLNETIVVNDQDDSRYAFVIYYGDGMDGLCTRAEIRDDYIIFGWWSDDGTGERATKIVLNTHTGTMEKRLMTRLRLVP